MIELKNFELHLPSGEKLFKPINITLSPGGILVITGRNGSGKSTLLHHLAINGSKEKLINISQNNICYLPQKYGLDFDFPFTLSAVLYQNKIKKDSIEHYQMQESLNLNRLWSTASGGERKKTLLLRCLYQEPELILMDEPFNHLDQKSRELFLLDLGHFLDRHPQTSLALITHDDIGHFLINRLVQYLDVN